MISIISNKFVLAGIAIVIILMLGKMVLSQRQEIKRQSSNYDVLIGQSSDALILKDKELTKYIDNDEQLRRALRDSLQIKDKRINDLMKSSSVSRLRFKTVLKDSLVLTYDTLNNAVTDTLRILQHFTYQDTWNTVKGLIDADTVMIDIKSQDTLIVVNYNYKKGKWFLPKLFSKWKTRTEITNMNPSVSYKIETRIEKI